MNDSLTPKQRLALFWLLFTGETPLQSKIRPKLDPESRCELERMELIHLKRRAKGRGKEVETTDKTWKWASENLESELMVSQYATPVLKEVLRKLGGFLRARSLNLSDFVAPSPQALPGRSLPQSSVEEQIRQAYLTLSKGRFSRMIRLADLKEAMSNIPSQEIDAALIEMQNKGDASLQTIESMRQTTEADRRAALMISGQPRNIVYLEK